METIKDTTFDFVLVLRQMFTENILRQKLDETGAEYHQGVECVDFTVDQTAGDYPVTSKFLNSTTGDNFELKRWEIGIRFITQATSNRPEASIL